MRKWVGWISFAAGGMILGWYIWSYFFLAFLTSQLMKDMNTCYLIQGLCPVLFSVPGFVGILLTVFGAVLLWGGKNNSN